MNTLSSPFSPRSHREACICGDVHNQEYAIQARPFHIIVVGETGPTCLACVSALHSLALADIAILACGCCYQEAQSHPSNVRFG